MLLIEDLLREISIPYATEGKNVSPGWVNITCPFCGDTSFPGHGGFNPERGTYVCWKCSFHPVQEVLMELLEISFYEATMLIQQYTTDTHQKIVTHMNRKKVTKVKLPEGCEELSEKHSSYLINRNYDPEYLKYKFYLWGTGFLGKYKFRIIAPIHVDNKMVSYQGRDITGKQIKYKACKKTEEVIFHKHVVYNIDSVKNRMVICEGITDVWRLGDGAVATFGIGWTKEQAIFIAKRKIKRVYILFDAEPIATEKANRLAWYLSSLNVRSKVIYLEEGDPGSMKQDDANHLMRELV